IGLDDLLGQERQPLQIFCFADVFRLDAAFVEQVAVIGNVLVTVPDQVPERVILVLCQFLWRPPLRLLQKTAPMLEVLAVRMRHRTDEALQVTSVQFRDHLVWQRMCAPLASPTWSYL